MAPHLSCSRRLHHRSSDDEERASDDGDVPAAPSATQCSVTCDGAQCSVTTVDSVGTVGSAAGFLDRKPNATQPLPWTGRYVATPAASPTCSPSTRR